MAQRATMTDIARELGLSRRTVSSVVNGKAAERRISDATAQRVLDYLNSQGFVPSRQAVSLRSGVRGSVGVLHSGYLYSHLVDAFNRIANTAGNDEAGVEIVIVPKNRIVDGFRELASRGSDRIVWIQSSDPDNEFKDADSLIPFFNRRTVAIYNYQFDNGGWDERLINAGAHLIGVDRSAAFRTLARFLKRLGHRVIAFPDAHPDRLPSVISVKINQFKALGLDVILTHPDREHFDSPDQAAQAMAHSLISARSTRRITAAVFHDDLTAGFAMAELARHGVDIPKDLTVIGFDGLAITKLMTPQLTSLSVPVSSMVDCVFEIFRRPSKERRHCFNIDLIKGGSHARSKQ
ncbi:MAG: LacI family DNA-binding transcriptional regulator [Planctomycetota bacterium]